MPSLSLAAYVNESVVTPVLFGVYFRLVTSDRLMTCPIVTGFPLRVSLPFAGRLLMV